MIIDKISNLKDYFIIHPKLKEIFEHLEQISLDLIEEGVTLVDEEKIKMIFCNTTLHPKKESFLETHKRHIDVHIPLSNKEVYGWKAKVDLLDCIQKYDSEKDIAIYADTPSLFFTLETDHFAIFLPEDAHTSLIGSGSLKKIIYKILLSN